jgi:aubergine-like protein
VDASFIELPNDRTESFIKAVRSRINSSLQLVVVIFPSPRDDRYSSIKKLCCIESPVPSQVINARTISQQQKLRSVTQKIALQINVKLGGELWALEIPLKNVMVIGIDVFHDNARGRRSVLGFVSSTNKTFTRWFSRVTIQDMNQEIGDGLKICFQNALSKYHELNNTLPDRIIIYRDGVGDGQMNMVYDFEVPQLKNCLVMFGENYSPKMGVVIVQKRISTRLFSHGHQGYDNPSPGTILDHTVTRKRKYDFFLVSQHVRQGTVTPTHYNIIYDTSGLKPDHMQRLTYKLTHLYYNWPGTIRVPAPCQYAHKLAFLVGQSLHSEPRNSLCDRLFFL